MNKDLVDKLLETGKILTIGKDINNNTTVWFEHGYIKDGDILIGALGKGETFGEAIIDYCRQISGRILVFDDPNGERETIIIFV